ncbi:MAG: glycyl-radical enzyme activating protein [Candidatus Krumholzibacteria bacterium]|nr:glycyl-radical enzyme activating protein [Candidatus Krumholzibacteria bacterium]
MKNKTIPNTGAIFDLKKFAIHDGPGIRTTVFFSGCPLACWWCHNPEGIEKNTFVNGTLRKRFFSDPEAGFTGSAVTIEDLMSEIKKDMVFYDQSGGGVTMSGGEPLMQPEFLAALLSACAESGIHTTLDTSGFSSRDVLERISGLVDLYMFDIKLMNDKDHLKYTGVSNRQILENFRMLCDSGRRIWARVPLIPGITDDIANLDSIVSFLVDCGKIECVSLLAYNRIGEDKFRRLNIEYKPGPLEKQDDGKLDEIRARFEGAGLVVSVGG